MRDSDVRLLRHEPAVRCDFKSGHYENATRYHLVDAERLYPGIHDEAPADISRCKAL